MKKMSIFAMLLAAVLVTSYSVSGTYAKYTSTFEGETSTARVAKWAFKFGTLNGEGGEDAVTTNDFTFNLFDTVNDGDANDANVKDGENGENIIAPGTNGSFEIKLYNASEVNAEYKVDYTVNNGNVPIEYSIDGTTWTTDLTDITTAVPINMGAGDSINIRWRWAFTGAQSTNYTSAQTDETDTALGNVGTQLVSVKAKITVTQVD